MPENKKSAPERFARGLMQEIVAIPKGLAQTILHPVDTYNGLVDASAEEFARAAAYNKGDLAGLPGFLGHTAAGFLPGIGPNVSSMVDQASEGDVAGALGRGTAFMASLVGPKALVGKLRGGPGAGAAEAAGRTGAASVPEAAVRSQIIKTLAKDADRPARPNAGGTYDISQYVDPRTGRLPSSKAIDRALESTLADMEKGAGSSKSLSEAYDVSHYKNPRTGKMPSGKAIDRVLEKEMKQFDHSVPEPPITRDPGDLRYMGDMSKINAELEAIIELARMKK